MKFTDFIITLAWPESLARTAEGPYDSISRSVNIFRDGFYKAGHAAFLLINEATGSVQYFDFGRYITPSKNGRIRSQKTDPELLFSIKAEITNGKISNLAKLIEYTGNHKHTHGSGVLYAGVQKNINHQLASEYITEKQSLPYIPYGPFHIGGTNCSRFVAQTIAKSLKKRGSKFLYPFYGTPSPLGNIYNSSEKICWKFNNSQVEQLDKYGILKHLNLLSSLLFFRKDESIPLTKQDTKGTIEPPNKLHSIPNYAQWLGGIGAGAWYFLDEIIDQQFKFGRQQADGHLDFKFWFETKNANFNPNLPFVFIYSCHALKLTISQNSKTFIFFRVLD